MFRFRRQTDATVATIEAWQDERAERIRAIPVAIVRDGFDTMATDGRDPRWLAARARVAAAGLDR